MAVIEVLELRRLLSASAFVAYPTVQLAAGTALSAPFTPSEIRQAYGLNSINFGSVAGNGAGQTIAIIDAYNDPYIQTDAAYFNTMYGLPQFNSNGPTFTVENELGQTTDLPETEPAGQDWDLEESLDVEWAHTVAPQANIILFEADSSGDDLYTAVLTAAATPGVSVVSMSFGGSEGSDETIYDPDFVTPAGHAGVTFLASTGDDAEPGGYPAFSPNVVAVGGTSLTINSDGTYGGETAWSGSAGVSGSGGGISAYETQPSYQTGKVNGTSSTKRTIPDVSWLANPNTGVDVYDEDYTGSGADSSHLYEVGGTSLACPMWGALFGIVDQGRALIGEAPLDGRSQALPLLYNISSNDFHDITSGSNGYSATVGYDLVTGRGSPVATAIANDLVNVPTLYVDSAAPGPTHNGSSWTDAYQTIQAAQAFATGGERIDVSQGTYYPGTSRTSSFTLVSGVDVYGGYAGYGAANPNAENPAAYPSILSGDIGTSGVSSDNAYHVVSATDINGGTVLQGFTIEDGNANGSSTNGDGAGLYVSINGPLIADCTFLDNTATTDGGGAYVAGTATSGRDGELTYNLAGGLFYNCIFALNTAAAGGGEAGYDADQLIVNCTFTANAGGAVFETNQTGRDTTLPTLTIYNSILWADTPANSEISSTNTTVTVGYSDVQGGYAGTGNINSNPLFIQTPSGSSEGNLELGSASPAIDAGSNTQVPPFLIVDAADNPRLVDYPDNSVSGAMVDMGAFEAQIPTVIAAALSVPGGQQFTFQFSQNVSSSLTVSDLTLTSLAGGPASSPSTLSYNATTNTATISLSAALPAGIYQVDLGAAGAHLAADDVFDILFVPGSSSLALSGEQTYTVQQFYISPAATLNIGQNAIAFAYTGTTPASSIASLITSAYNGGTWSGPGITSSVIAQGSAVGYYDSGTSVTVRLTWDGDANLSGNINADDLSLIALGQAQGGTRWQDGNFNYDDKVNADDWMLFFLGAAVSDGVTINSAVMTSASLPAHNFNSTLPSISASAVFSNVQAMLDSADDNSLIA